MSADLPPPAPTPPSIEQAVKDYVDIIDDVRELKKGLALVNSTVSRLVEAQTVDRMQLGRIERLLVEIRAAQMRQELK